MENECPICRGPVQSGRDEMGRYILCKEHGKSYTGTGKIEMTSEQVRKLAADHGLRL